MQTFHFFSHFNLLLSLIDEADFIKRVITHGDKLINFQLIMVYVSHALLRAQGRATVRTASLGGTVLLISGSEPWARDIVLFP